MSMKRNWFMAIALIVPLVFLGGCQFGKVDQGRVIKFDKDKKELVMIRDWKADVGNPDYTHLPPVTYKIPEDPNEMGPEPKAGQRMNLDAKGKHITIFDMAKQDFKTIDYTLIDQKENVGRDDPAVKDRKFPEVDKAKKTITVYSGRQKILTTFSLPEEYFALPDSTWDAGDEVRIYYKEDGKALRLMNITRTDIFKK